MYYERFVIKLYNENRNSQMIECQNYHTSPRDETRLNHLYCCAGPNTMAEYLLWLYEDEEDFDTGE